MDFYDYLGALSESSCPADMLVYAIIRDLKGRKGFRNEFDAVDPDILIEMIDGWREEARKVMSL